MWARRVPCFSDKRNDAFVIGSMLTTVASWRNVPSLSPHTTIQPWRVTRHTFGYYVARRLVPFPEKNSFSMVNIETGTRKPFRKRLARRFFEKLFFSANKVYIGETKWSEQHASRSTTTRNYVCPYIIRNGYLCGRQFRGASRDSR